MIWQIQLLHVTRFIFVKILLGFRFYLPHHIDKKLFTLYTPSLFVDRRKAFKVPISIFCLVTMTIALARKTNERPGTLVLTAKMSFSPIASSANVDGGFSHRGNICVSIFRITDNGDCVYHRARWWSLKIAQGCHQGANNRSDIENCANNFAKN